MTRKFIAYDLHDKDSQDYQDLYDFIEETYESYRVLESMYVIFSDESNEKIRDDVLKIVGKRNASLMVGNLPKPVRSHNVPFKDKWCDR